ncbi:uncharacterized protein C8R40DRAFT_1062959 [Lentinula edodes]|uniref:uncharacterized protein n=1 Tax=Lentinula edodes TaxID=5353 RepID=UPI001E8D7936|nr:uncharacterized protein C8R40DRAFT_1062959 [Lentinula edodes]KAH7868063.1 hypothetical protein C8R40DRAFT_1062959 [Lentinula edodes]
MSNFQIPPHADESALKKLEKKIIDEGKAEDAHVSHTLKDLSKVEKASGKADKTFDKSEHALEKTHKKELKASNTLNKATHKHDLAVAAIGNAEKDLAVKKQESARLQAEVEQRKASVDGIIEAQRHHNVGICSLLLVSLAFDFQLTSMPIYLSPCANPSSPRFTTSVLVLATATQTPERLHLHLRETCHFHLFFRGFRRGVVTSVGL